MSGRGGRGGGAAAGAGMKRMRIQPSTIPNKMKRSQVFSKQKADAKKDKREARKQKAMIREELGDKAPAKAVPHTQENTREVEDTLVEPDDHEVFGDERDDEFAEIFAGTAAPKIMITTSPSPSGKIYRMIAEFMAVIPHSFFYKRKKFRLKKICQWAAEMDFTHVLVLSERAKVANGLMIIKLPFGPTAAFKVTAPKLSSEIMGRGLMTSHIPEIILNNFITRVGRRVGRILASLFPHNPEFVGRRVCTFHNQRDFVFFRQHRYIFKEDGSGVRLQELGPRFTLKLKWILAGTFDTKYGDYEWYHKRHEMETSRRRFLL